MDNNSNQISEEQRDLLREIAEFGVEWKVSHRSPLICLNGNGIREVNTDHLSGLIKAGCLSVRLTGETEPEPVLLYQFTDEGIRQFVGCFPGLKALADKLATVG